MHWPRSGNQVELGEHLYAFESRHPDNRICLVDAHAHPVAGSASHFVLRPGMSLRYWIGHGQTLRASYAHAIHGSSGHGQAFTHGPDSFVAREPLFINTGPKWIDNYFLTSSRGAEELQMGDQYYLGIGAAMVAAADIHFQHRGRARMPMVVTVRNRSARRGKFLLLSDVIEAVKERYPLINEIHACICRGPDDAPEFPIYTHLGPA